MGKVTSIKTEALGDLSWTRFNKLVKTSGSQAEVARVLTAELGREIKPGTVRKWGQRLRAARQTVSS